MKAPARCLRWLGASTLLLLAACASVPTPSPPTPPAPLPRNSTATQTANDVLMRAIGLVGTPYHWGGNTPASGFDCSGLVVYVFRTQADIVLPRTSRAMGRLDAPRVEKSRLASGDLVFFGQHRKVTHVGIYVGNGRFVNAPNAGGTVRLDRLDGDYWRDHYLFAKRVLGIRAVETFEARK